VLIGDMTLVGPRPLDVRESTRIARWGRRRLLVKPGLTCIWQVHGKSKVSFNEWMRMDIRYAQKISLWHDLKLMLATLRQMILRQASH
jgi:lipopolysaccharide/colanic/teichoic acid biosynthesis glycosyltransferase